MLRLRVCTVTVKGPRIVAPDCGEVMSDETMWLVSGRAPMGVAEQKPCGFWRPAASCPEQKGDDDCWIWASPVSSEVARDGAQIIVRERSEPVPVNEPQSVSHPFQ